MKKLVIVLILLLMILPLTGFIGCDGDKEVTSTPTPTATLALTPTVAATLSVADAISKVNPAVVVVETVDGTGSGMIIDNAGYVLTNSHVVEGTNLATIILPDGREFYGIVLGRDEITDLAVVEINGDNLPVANMGSSNDLQIGQDVISIGYALGLEGSATVSKGIVSAFRTDYEVTHIQTDAAINPGNSGGPLITLNGEVVGINTWKYVRVDVEGMNYAIAIDSAQSIIPQLIAGESILAYTPMIDKPIVSYVPENWYLSNQISYPEIGDETYDVNAGLIEYTDNTDHDFIMIYYGDIPSPLIGKATDENALIDVACAWAYTFDKTDETGTMTISDRIAGYAMAYDSTADCYEIAIVFVKGETCINIYAYYDAPAQNEQEVMSLIDSVSFASMQEGVMFSDDFSDSLSGWDTYSASEGSVAYSNGWLHVTNYTNSERAAISYYPYTFRDFIIEVETKLVDGSDNNWHTVGCRNDLNGNYYSFGISADGYYGIEKWVNGEQIVLKEPVYSVHIRPGYDVTNKIRIECIGNTLKLSVNGNILASVNDFSYNEGYISLECSALAGQFSEIAFDNFAVYAP